MSVVKSQRNESTMEFLVNARKLQAYTIRKCVNCIPKRYTFFIGTALASSATKIYESVKKGNSIYPINQHEVQMRRDYFLAASLELQSLISQIELADEMLSLDKSVVQEWSKLISTETRLVKAIMKSDREKYKSLPE